MQAHQEIRIPDPPKRRVGFQRNSPPSRTHYSLQAVLIPILKRAGRVALAGSDGLREMTGNLGCAANRLALLHADHDLAEVRARSHVLVGRRHFVEAKHLVDDRLDVVRRDKAVHRLKHLRRAD